MNYNPIESIPRNKRIYPIMIYLSIDLFIYRFIYHYLRIPIYHQIPLSNRICSEFFVPIFFHPRGLKKAVDTGQIDQSSPKNGIQLVMTHRIHVWYIYLHLAKIYGKCR